MFSTTLTQIVLLAAASLKAVEALTINTPSGLTSGGMATITWTATSSDPPFSIELVHPSFNQEFAIANSVNPANQTITLQLPPVPPGSDYQLAFVNLTNINDVFASSSNFSVAAATSSTSGSASGTAKASGSASGSSTGSASGSATSSTTSASTSPSPSSAASASQRVSGVVLGGILALAGAAALV
ncbi:hypothetical protein HMN09_00811100 [Mycena chlorophos]|uniref:Yeast cell wall synthesis Kre9/Knh1-like N-terminal domain-containing protein n=1 Tax=Mycena chlorophos TaxID=658473 RepID=A0A8H6W4N1_MYCCL|nr:hypothetical protein HMN09_00811100 [Mycena chlorophos]